MNVKAIRRILAASLPGTLLMFSSAAAKWPAEDMEFLAGMTRDVVEHCRVKAGGKFRSQLNTTGITLIRPGGAYQGGSWIRDFTMSIGSGFITTAEIADFLMLVARSQNGPDSNHFEKGHPIPPHAIPGNITYSGSAIFSNRPLPPIDDHYDFTHLAWHLFAKTGSTDFLQDTIDGMRLLDRLTIAFDLPRTDSATGLVETDAKNRAVGFGFCDAIYLTGKMLFPSLLRCRAAGELADLHDALGLPQRADDYRAIREKISENLVCTFGADTDGEKGRIGGWLMAATTIGRQPDVWGTLFALHLGVLEGSARDTAIGTVLDAVRRETITYQAGVRHVPTDLNARRTSAWEKTTVSLKIGTYQNGAYWHTATGWLIETVARRDSLLAAQLFDSFIDHLRKNDYRLKKKTKAPWECFGPRGYTKGNAYMTSVALPYAILSSPPSDMSPAITASRAEGGPRPVKILLRGPEVLVTGLNTDPVSLRFFSANGRLVHAIEEARNGRAMLPPLKTGMYVVKMQGRKGSTVTRFLVY